MPVSIERLERGYIRREENGDTIHVAGPADMSREFRHWESGLGIVPGDRYDSRCGFCYLNASHSVAKHAASVVF